jgi:methyl-accepting chemotaxis protein
LIASVNISAVSEETAAASEEMSAMALNQINSVEGLSQSALELASDANKSNDAIKLFKIS